MSKLPNVGTTIFTVMSKLAQEHQAINLAQGFPNFPVDDRLTAILEKKATDSFHQYMPMGGFPPLLEKIGRQIQNAYGRQINSSNELLITAGATQGIFTFFQALIGHGDEVIILDPSYDCYDPSIVLAGGTPVHIAMEKDYTINWSALEQKFNTKTKCIIINNPHNPSGKILTEQDFEALENLLDKHPQVILLSDEVYEYITFEEKHISANSREALLDKTCIVSSFGKTFHITGWKMGYLVAPKSLMDEIKKVHQFLVFSVNSVAQATLSDYLDVVDVSQLGSFYQQKRDLFRELLKGSRFELLPSEGSYFQVASFANLSEEKDTDFALRLVEDFGIAVIPMSVFNASGLDHKHIRFCYAKTDETLIKSAEILCKI
jgi:methionine transaminase